MHCSAEVTESSTNKQHHLSGESEVDPKDYLGGVTVFGIVLALEHDKTVSVAVPHSGHNLHELYWQNYR